MAGLLGVRQPPLWGHGMTDLEFHRQTCSACQRGKSCPTADQLPRTLRDSTKPLLIRTEQGPDTSITRKAKQ